MKKTILLLLATTLSFGSALRASQADDTTVSVIAQDPGATPFIEKLTILVSGDASTVKSFRYSIAPKPGSVTRPLSTVYDAKFLNEHGAFDSSSNQATVAVWGLYAGFDNTVLLTYAFNDGSSKQQTIHIVTDAYVEPGNCHFNTPTVLQPRTDSKDLSYDYVLVASSCNTNSPTIIDTDGTPRWVGTADVSSYTTTFYDNAVYLSDGPRLLRIEMDGSVNIIADYSNIGVRELHHNIERGKTGLILEVDTDDYLETVNLEVDPLTGDVLRTFNLGTIISDAMRAGGDDPSQFVRFSNGDYNFSSPSDWWHNNANTYRRSDDTLLVSSRENFVVALDYETKEIKWIFGDHNKQWYTFPSLAKFALDVTPGTLAPEGQHALSITKDNNLLLFDNGQESQHHTPAGPHRNYSAPRKYALDLVNNIATAIYRYDNNQSVMSPFCSSVYEDAPSNYVVDYAVVGGINANTTAQVFGLTARDELVFKYSYTSGPCSVAYRSLPLRLENVSFPTSDVQLANISSRAQVNTNQGVTIAGFIVTGDTPKSVVVRGLGPSLPVAGKLADPVLELHNSSGQIVESDDNYATVPADEKATIARAHLVPSDPNEAAIARVLAPGAYTAVLRGARNTTGIGLVEVYDIDLKSGSKLANISTRAFVSTGDEQLIGGLILRGNATKRILFRALGPELQNRGIANALPDTTLQLVDQNGVTFASNDDWQTVNNRAELEATGLAPTNSAESALLMPFVAGNYTAIVNGKNGTSGIGLIEIYQLAD